MSSDQNSINSNAYLENQKRRKQNKEGNLLIESNNFVHFPYQSKDDNCKVSEKFLSEGLNDSINFEDL